MQLCRKADDSTKHNFMQSLRSRYFFLLSQSHEGNYSAEKKCTIKSGIELCPLWQIGSNLLEALLHFSTLAELYNNIHIFRYQNDYSILYERKCIHKNIMSFTKYFSLSRFLLLGLWPKFSGFSGFYSFLITRQSSNNRMFHQFFTFNSQKIYFFSYFYCSVINVIQQLCRATSRCAPFSTEYSLKMMWMKRKKDFYRVKSFSLFLRSRKRLHKRREQREGAWRRGQSTLTL